MSYGLCTRMKIIYTSETVGGPGLRSFFFDQLPLQKKTSNIPKRPEMFNNSNQAKKGTVSHGFCTRTNRIFMSDTAGSHVAISSSSFIVLSMKYEVRGVLLSWRGCCYQFYGDVLLPAPAIDAAPPPSGEDSRSF